MESLSEHEGKKELQFPEIAADLLKRKEIDQKMRQDAPRGLAEWDHTIDRGNTEAVKSIISQIGWPSVSKVGKEASEAAWLLVQHADHDPKFQQECLDLMRQEPKTEIKTQDLAFLEDRVRVNTGRPTLYGTQFMEDESGVFRPRPIEDIENLDRRRAEAGLGSFAEYEQEIRRVNREVKEPRRSQEEK